MREGKNGSMGGGLRKESFQGLVNLLVCIGSGKPGQLAGHIRPAGGVVEKGVCHLIEFGSGAFLFGEKDRSAGLRQKAGNHLLVHDANIG